VAAIGKGLFVYYFEKYTESKLTSEGGAFFRAKSDDGSDGPAPEEQVADGDGSSTPADHGTTDTSDDA
jgi:hypothetical protein